MITIDEKIHIQISLMEMLKEHYKVILAERYIQIFDSTILQQKKGFLNDMAYVLNSLSKQLNSAQLIKLHRMLEDIEKRYRKLLKIDESKNSTKKLLTFSNNLSKEEFIKKSEALMKEHLSIVMNINEIELKYGVAIRRNQSFMYSISRLLESVTNGLNGSFKGYQIIIDAILSEPLGNLYTLTEHWELKKIY